LYPEATAMIILGIILSVFAIAFFCWLLFTLAVYALPCFVGMSLAFAAYHHGYGVLASGLIALIAGAGILAAGQLLFATVRVPILRAGIALIFAIPAAVAGYHATLGIAHITMPPGSLGELFAIVGAVLVGGTAWSRMAIYLPPVTVQGTEDEIASPQLPANG
jgi:hypothetical protein